MQDNFYKNGIWVDVTNYDSGLEMNPRCQRNFEKGQETQNWFCAK